MAIEYPDPVQPHHHRSMDAESGENKESYQPPAKKLRHDVTMRGKEHEGQRQRQCSSYDDQGQGSGSASHANEEEESETSSSPPPPATMTEEKKQGACHDHDHDHSVEFSDALLARLSEISASAPRFVVMKRLHSTDVRDDQNRLQLSGRSPISKIFTDAEKARVRTSDGMPVTAFDRRGRRYEMTCKLWRDDKHYRFMGAGWKSFRQAHGLTIGKEAHLTRSLTVKLWAFRSRALLLPKKVKDDGGEEKEEESGHPDGALGLVVLLLDEGEQDEEVDGDDSGEEEEVARDESNARNFQELMGAVALWLLWTRDD